MSENEYQKIGADIIDGLKDAIRASFKMIEHDPSKQQEIIERIGSLNDRIEVIQKAIAHISPKPSASTTTKPLRRG